MIHPNIITSWFWRLQWFYFQWPWSLCWLLWGKLVSEFPQCHTRASRL